MNPVKSTVLPVPPYLLALLFYSTIMFVVQLSDGVMSYVTPIFIEQTVNNPLIMGLILSSSSVFGIVCDMLFPSIFRARHHLFFFWNTVLLALLFPAVLLFFPHTLPTMILAMAIWGIYFEFMAFSNAYFIEAYISLNRHGLAWGVVSIFRSLSMFVAPVIAPLLLHTHYSHPLITAMALLVCGMGGILLFQKFFPHKKRVTVNEVVIKRYSFTKELRIWQILMKKLWPMYLFVLAIFILEATMMSVGVLATEELRQGNFWGGMLLAAYTLPNIFTGFLVHKLGIQLGKKRLAFTCGVIGGCCLSLATFITSPTLVVLMTFVAACFLSLTYPSMRASLQDYTTRLGVFGGEMIGIGSSSASLGYIIGPLLAGGVSLLIGNIPTIGLMAALFASIAMLNILIVPRKVHMPQKELQVAVES